MERVAIIDLGSNSIRFIIMSIADNKSYRLEYQHKESIRLGRGMSETGRLNPDGVKRAFECLHVYKNMMEALGVTKTIAVATAAARAAEDGASFVERVEAEIGIHIDVISGDREAYLGFLGTINTMAERDFVLFDLGGASVEVTLVRNRKPEKAFSVPLGAVTMTDKFQLSDKASDSAIAKCRKYVQKKFDEMIPWVRGAHLPIIGIGGTARTFAKMDQARKDYQLARIHNYAIGRDDFDSIAKELQDLDLAERKKVEGLSSDRADLILAGSIIIETLMQMTDGTELLVSGCGLRDGVFYEYYGERYGEGPILHDVLRASLDSFLGWQERRMDHLGRVARLALSLFDQLQTLHKEPQRMRDILEVAAWLHDTGKNVNYFNHARHSAFIIAHAPLYGLRHIEQLEAGFIAGFHHGVSQKTVRAYRYAMMLSDDEWKSTRRMGILLALAEAADVTYEGVVEEIRAIDHEEAVTLAIRGRHGTDHSTARFAMMDYAKAFKKEYGKPLLFV